LKNTLCEIRLQALRERQAHNLVLVVQSFGFRVHREFFVVQIMPAVALGLRRVPCLVSLEGFFEPSHLYRNRPKSGPPPVQTPRSRGFDLYREFFVVEVVPAVALCLAVPHVN
jgi:hypothetical protein